LRPHDGPHPPVAGEPERRPGAAADAVAARRAPAGGPRLPRPRRAPGLMARAYVDFRIRDPLGRVIRDADIEVRDPDTLEEVPLYYTEESVDPIDHAPKTDPRGIAYAWLEEGTYEWRAVRGSTELAWEPFRVTRTTLTELIPGDRK